jgi:hypothetical protein
MADDIKPGDRVWVRDRGLTELRAIMRSYGHTAQANHHGTVNDILPSGDIEIWFDNEDGPGMGQAAPYPRADVRRFPDPEYPEAE